MRKVSLKSQTLPLCLGLLLLSSPVLAGYSDDADCKAVSDSAKAAGNRALGRIEDTATKTGTSIQQAKSCVDEVIAQANRAVSDFGGGAIAGFASQLLAKQGCQMLSNAQSQLQGQVMGALPAGATQAIGTINSNMSGTGVPTIPSAPSIWQRITNIF